MNRAELDNKRKTAVDVCASSYNVDSLSIHPYPYHDNDTGDVLFSYILMQKISGTSSSGDPTSYLSFLAYLGEDEKGDDRYEVWCEDSFIEGKTTKIDPTTRVDLAAKDLHKDTMEPLTKEMIALYGSQPSMVSAGPGHYWKTIKSGKFCKHVNSMLATIIDKDVNQLKTKYKAAFKPAKKATKAKTGVADTFLPKVAKYAFMKHVCVEGEKGSGKTYSIDKYVKENGWNTEFIGGHEGIETIDLLGHLVKHTEEVAGSDFKGAKGNVFTTVSVTQYVDRMVWKDGPLTAAFRSASAGKETVLFIDEILRIPSRELNILVAALTPNSSKQYVLRTGHITGLENGVAKEETLVADCNKLWIVATTNVGADYQVDTIDEALVDRFRFIRKDNDRNEIKSILEEQAKAKKYGASVVGQLMSFYDTYSNLRTMGQVNKLLNLRHLSEAIEFGSTVDEVEENLVDLIPSLVDRTPEGYLEQEQVKLIEAAIKKAFM